MICWSEISKDVLPPGFSERSSITVYFVSFQQNYLIHNMQIKWVTTIKEKEPRRDVQLFLNNTRQDTARTFQTLVARDPEGRECVSFIFIVTQGGSDRGKNM